MAEFHPPHPLLYCMSRSVTELMVVQGRELSAADIDQIRGMIGGSILVTEKQRGRSSVNRLAQLVHHRAGPTRTQLPPARSHRPHSNGSTTTNTLHRSTKPLPSPKARPDYLSPSGSVPHRTGR